MQTILLTKPDHAPAGAWVLAAIALGSNLGERGRTLRDAVVAIANVPGVRLVGCSKWYATEPVGPVSQREYFNGAVVVQTTLRASELLAVLLAIEQSFGRDRSMDAQRWGPRTLDLDLLLFGNEVVQTAELVVPHPRMHERLFVLEPLGAIASAMIVPGTDGTKQTVGELLAKLRGASMTDVGVADAAEQSRPCELKQCGLQTGCNVPHQIMHNQTQKSTSRDIQAQRAKTRSGS